MQVFLERAFEEFQICFFIRIPDSFEVVLGFFGGGCYLIIELFEWDSQVLYLELGGGFL